MIAAWARQGICSWPRCRRSPRRAKRYADRSKGLGLTGVRASAETVLKNGIAGLHIKVTVHGEDEAEPHEHHHEHHDHPHHEHRSLGDICRMIDGFELPEKVREDAKAVYALIAQAEGRVHGREVGEVHFHEVGALDAVADVTGVCLLMYELGAERVVASPVPGRVRLGEMRARRHAGAAPATALLLEGVPVYAGDIEGEMCTPTGAALVKYFADEYGTMPEMIVERSGFGMGTRDYERVNGLRAIVGEAKARLPRVTELRCNLDDITAEDLAFAQELLLEHGALDVYTQTLGMKKGRVGVMLTCLCAEEREEEFAQLMLKHTPTLGLRVYHPGADNAGAQDGEAGDRAGRGHGKIRGGPRRQEVKTRVRGAEKTRA